MRQEGWAKSASGRVPWAKGYEAQIAPEGREGLVMAAGRAYTM